MTTQFLSPRTLLVGGFFLLYLLVGLAAYDDYGISTDEPIQRQHGLVSLKYLVSLVDPALAAEKFPDLPALDSYETKHYGVAFHLPLVAAEEFVLRFADARSLWLFRHAATFLFFYAGVFAFYRLGAEKFGWPLGLLGAALLVTTPRIFAESFYNVKDTTFLAAFCIALYGAMRYWRQPTMTRGALFGAAAAFATNVRIVAIFLFALGLGIVFLDALRAASGRRRLFASMAAAAAAFAAVFLVTAPASWSNPLTYFIDSIRLVSGFDLWDGRIWYGGVFIRGDRVPWHYLPVWMLITIPASVLALFAIGAAGAVTAALRVRVRLLWLPREREDVAFLLVFALPIVATVVLHSTLYSGWRHLTFVFAPMLLIALRGAWMLLHRFAALPATARVGRTAIVVLFAAIGIYHANVVRWMAVNHPNQPVYFNHLIAQAFGGREGFERDYWRLSMRQALEYIAATDPRPALRIAAPKSEITNAKTILPPADADRMTQAEPLDLSADYIVDTYRAPVGRFDSAGRRYEITVDGLPIMTVYSVPDLIAALNVEETPAGLVLRFNSYPFFAPRRNNDRNPLVEDNGVPASLVTTLDVRLPVSLLARVGDTVTVSIAQRGITSENLRPAVCDAQPFDALRLTDDRIEFTLEIAGRPLDSFIDCTLRFRSDVTVYDATVTAAD